MVAGHTAFLAAAGLDVGGIQVNRDRHRFADIRDTRNRRATSRSLAPASINSAAASRTCSRRARSAAVSPPPSAYLMHPAYLNMRQPSPGP